MKTQEGSQQYAEVCSRPCKLFRYRASILCGKMGNGTDLLLVPEREPPWAK